MIKDKWNRLNKELDDALEEEFGSEEPKQETLEELAKEFYSDENQLMERIAFKRGYTECKENSYSEEEAGELVYTIIGQYGRHYGIMIDGAKLNELFKEFKKK
jgi:hypothetical protein